MWDVRESSRAWWESREGGGRGGKKGEREGRVIRHHSPVHHCLLFITTRAITIGPHIHAFTVLPTPYQTQKHPCLMECMYVCMYKKKKDIVCEG